MSKLKAEFSRTHFEDDIMSCTCFLSLLSYFYFKNRAEYMAGGLDEANKEI